MVSILNLLVIETVWFVTQAQSVKRWSILAYSRTGFRMALASAPPLGQLATLIACPRVTAQRAVRTAMKRRIGEEARRRFILIWR
jgi:hypothetical protein|tara:strand:- start:1391 stop:1645 length:255 start_codon:yes stop_codon:yes gene_type:complete